MNRATSPIQPGTRFAAISPDDRNVAGKHDELHRAGQRLLLTGHERETVREDDAGFIHVDGRRLREPYIPAATRWQDVELRNHAWHVSPGRFFLLGDNRPNSCDSRIFGAVSAKSIRGVVTAIRRDGREIRVR